MPSRLPRAWWPRRRWRAAAVGPSRVAGPSRRGPFARLFSAAAAPPPAPAVGLPFCCLCWLCFVLLGAVSGRSRGPTAPTSMAGGLLLGPYRAAVAALRPQCRPPAVGLPFCLCGSRFVGSALRPRPLCGYPPPLVSVGPPRLALSSARGAVRCSPSAVLRLVCSGLRGVAALPPLAPFAAASRLQVSFCLCALLVARRAASAGALLRPRCLGPVPFGSLSARLRSRCLGCSGPFARPRSLCSLRALLRAWLLASLPTALPSGVCLGLLLAVGMLFLCGSAAAGLSLLCWRSCLSWRRRVLVSGVRVAWVVLVYVYMSRRSATARLRLRTPCTFLIRFAPQNCARGLLLSQNSPAYIPKPRCPRQPAVGSTPAKYCGGNFYTRTGQIGGVSMESSWTPAGKIILPYRKKFVPLHSVSKRQLRIKARLSRDQLAAK